MEKIDQTLSSTGLLTTHNLDNDGVLHTTYAQDLEPMNDLFKSLDKQAMWKQGVKDNFAFAFSVPEPVIPMLKKMGIDIFDPNVRLQDVAAGMKALEMGNFIVNANA